jgi:DNA-binding transcriptional LysR family regulator
MSNIPTDLLRTFVKAIDTGSFTRAGEIVGRTQSAVSLQIRRLENLLQTQLFERDTHRMSLTDEGRTLAELKRHERGEFDLVIALHDDPNETAGTKVFTEPLVWITSGDHVRHEQQPLSLVVAPPPCIYRNRAVQILNRLERPWRIVYASSSYSGISAAVRAGIGVTVMAESTAPYGVRKLGESDGFPPLGELDVRLHMARENASEAMRTLADYITSSFARPELTGPGGSSQAFVAIQE